MVVAGGDGPGAEQEAVGGEVGWGEVAFEGGEVVPADGGVSGVGVAVEVAVGKPGGGGDGGEDPVAGVEAQAASGFDLGGGTGAVPTRARRSTDRPGPG